MSEKRTEESGHHEIDPNRTRIRVTLSTGAALITAVVGAATWTVRSYSKMEYQLSRVEERMADQVATKSDLAELKREITKGMGRSLREARVRCPKYVMRGSEMVICAVEFELEDR